MKEHEWDYEALEREMIKTSGALHVASLLKRGYANTVAGIIAEFDRIATDEKKARDYVANLLTNWWAVTGPNGEYWSVDMREWETVEEKILRRYPNIDFPSFLDSAAHRSGVDGKDPHGRKFDRRQR